MPGTHTPAVLRALPSRIVLTGFMGSGKTSVGRLLAAALNWHFIDLDNAVSKRTGLSVPDIFARFGEAHFRREEADALAAVLCESNLVLALGGGAPETVINRKRLAASPGTEVIHLAGPFAELQARCFAQAAEPGAIARPVLADEALAHERFRRRLPLYGAIATLTLETSGVSAQQLAEAVLRRLGLPLHAHETP